MVFPGKGEFPVHFMRGKRARVLLRPCQESMEKGSRVSVPSTSRNDRRRRLDANGKPAPPPALDHENPDPQTEGAQAREGSVIRRPRRRTRRMRHRLCRRARRCRGEPFGGRVADERADGLPLQYGSGKLSRKTGRGGGRTHPLSPEMTRPGSDDLRSRRPGIIRAMAAGQFQTKPTFFRCFSPKSSIPSATSRPPADRKKL